MRVVVSQGRLSWWHSLEHERLSQGVSTFNDDIESTAAAIVASFLGAEQLKGVPPLKEQTILMLGAGQANI